jgi:hypothetical protein
MALDALLLGGSSSAIARGCSHCGASADRSLPSIKVDDADAATWRLALQFLDPNAEQPEVDWVSGLNMHTVTGCYRYDMHSMCQCVYHCIHSHLSVWTCW